MGLTRDEQGEILHKYNGTTSSDIIDRRKVYARERYHTFFYVFNNIEDCENFRDECKRKEPYIWYDGYGIYSKEKVNKICGLLDNGERDKIRY